MSHWAKIQSEADLKVTVAFSVIVFFFCQYFKKWTSLLKKEKKETKAVICETKPGATPLTKKEKKQYCRTDREFVWIVTSNPASLLAVITVMEQDVFVLLEKLQCLLRLSPQNPYTLHQVSTVIKVLFCSENRLKCSRSYNAHTFCFHFICFQSSLLIKASSSHFTSFYFCSAHYIK